MKITHIHARVGTFQGGLYFVVDGRLLRVDVGTPNFNDYNEWRISNWTMSKTSYNPDENTYELTPYKNFLEIEITEKELQMLDNPDNQDVNPISGEMYKYQRRMAIYNSGKEIKMTDWDKKKDKTSFEKVFFPILENFRIGYLERFRENKRMKQ